LSQSEQNIKQGFDELFLETLHGTLRGVLGDLATEVIIQHISRRYSLRWKEIPENIETFWEALKDILGPSASLLENLVIQQLCSTLGLERNEKDFIDIQRLKVKFEDT